MDNLLGGVREKTLEKFQERNATVQTETLGLRGETGNGVHQAPPLRRLQNLEAAHEVLVHRHHGARVVELAAVVGRAEHRHQLPLSKELVPVLHHLVGGS